MPQTHWSNAVPLVFLVALLAACEQQPEQPIDDDLYSTRNRVELLASLEPDAGVTATLEFDTKAVILEQHRSYVRIRTDSGQEGWIHREMILNRAQRGQLAALGTQSAQLPNQGLYRARDTLNVHITPYRWAPTFYQLEKDEDFQMLDRVLVERLPARARDARIPPAPTGLDHWYFVRLAGIDQHGWLLANMAYSDLPIEIAMLAQGHPVTSYFALGSVEDRTLGESKTTWLWAQAVTDDNVHDFDRIQVFRWDSRRHRYVVIRRESGLVGYQPIEILPEFETDKGTGTGFRILLDRNGELVYRTYVYANHRVFSVGQEPVTAAPRHVPPGGIRALYGKGPAYRPSLD